MFQRARTNFDINSGNSGSTGINSSCNLCNIDQTKDGFAGQDTHGAGRILNQRTSIRRDPLCKTLNIGKFTSSGIYPSKNGYSFDPAISIHGTLFHSITTSAISTNPSAVVNSDSIGSSNAAAIQASSTFPPPTRTFKSRFAKKVLSASHKPSRIPSYLGCAIASGISRDADSSREGLTSSAGEESVRVSSGESDLTRKSLRSATMLPNDGAHAVATTFSNSGICSDEYQASFSRISKPVTNSADVTPLPLPRGLFSNIGCGVSVSLLNKQSIDRGSKETPAGFELRTIPSGKVEEIESCTPDGKTAFRPYLVSSAATTVPSARNLSCNETTAEEKKNEFILFKQHKSGSSLNALTTVESIKLKSGLWSFQLSHLMWLLLVFVSFYGLAISAILKDFKTGQCKLRLSRLSQKRFGNFSMLVCSKTSTARFIPKAVRYMLNIKLMADGDLRYDDFNYSNVEDETELWRWQSDAQEREQSQYLSESNDKMQSDAIIKDVEKRLSDWQLSGAVERAMNGTIETEMLYRHSEEFNKRIEHVVDNVFVAIGYGLANVVFIETKNGDLILFDTLENPNNMRILMDDWTKERSCITKRSCFSPSASLIPRVVAIFYSHFHPDHVFGASAVFRKGETEVWAHETTDVEMARVFSVTAGATYTRSMKQFGSLLTEGDGFINSGIGKRLFYDSSNGNGPVIRATKVWKGDRSVMEIQGEILDLIYAPGESKDQTVILLPRKRVLFGADNIYKALPNIYAIRGTESRNALQWVKSLDIMRALKPEYLVLGHTGPLKGAEEIQSIMTAYRDGIQYIHDQTLRLMNKGFSEDEIVSVVKLPPHLSSHPYLQPFYGTVAWNVRAVIHHYLGWFSGLSEDLEPLSKKQRAMKMAAMVGGREVLLRRSIEALESEDHQWGLELVRQAEILSPSCRVTKNLKAKLLRSLAGRQTSAPGRNWYLTEARESEEFLQNQMSLCEVLKQCKNRNIVLSTFKQAEIASNYINGVFNSQKASSPPSLLSSSLSDLVNILYGNSSHFCKSSINSKLKITKAQKDQCIKNLKSAVDVFGFVSIRFRAEVALDVDAVISFTFTDTKHFACLHLRRGIAFTTTECERKPDIHVSTTDETWKALVTHDIKPLAAIARGKFRIDSSDPRDYIRLKNLLELIEIDVE